MSREAGNAEICEKLSQLGVIPVAVINDSNTAVGLAKALTDGGLPCAEITFRTDAAAEAIKRITEAFPDMLLGAGTVLTKEQVDKAADAGAKFIVTPGFNEDVVKYCIEKELPIFPGCMDTYAIEKALSLGFDTVKFFPAETCGGVAMIKALSGPYRNLKFMPTGGINAGNVEEYLKLPQVVACGGSWMVKGELVDAGRFDEIKALAEEAVSIVRKVKG